MTFLALNMDACFLTQQKSDLEFEEMMYSNEYTETTNQISTRYSELSSTTSSTGSTSSTSTTSSSSSTENDPMLQQLKSMQDYYQSKKDGIESQLKAINADLEGYKEAVKTNVKSECKLSISA